MSVEASAVFRIGKWRVDAALDEISADGKIVKLEPRAMRVLVCLADRAGDVVSVDQLLKVVWRDVVVTPDSVYQVVAGLRRALADVEAGASYIVNVPRRGYRLVAPVTSPYTDAPRPIEHPAFSERVAAVPISVTADSSEDSSAVMRPVRRWLWGICLAVTIAVVGYWLSGRFWSQQNDVVALEPTAAVSDSGEPSIAVLPFVDISDHRDQEYLADGLSVELIDRLARVPGLHVSARASSLYFKGKQASVPEIAKALHVSHLLEGSIRKSGNTLRVSTQLLRVDNGFQVWSKTFDRPLTDVFKIQDEIANAVVQVLELSLVAHYTPVDPPTDNIEAYSLYYRSQLSIVSNGVQDYEAAAAYLHSALTLDPQYAAAWAQLALDAMWRFDMRSAPTVAACAEARAAADRALNLDSHLARAHRAAGIVLQYCDSNFTAAETEFKQSLEFDAGGSEALRSLAWLAIDANRLVEAVQLAHRAVVRDPLNAWDFAALGDAYWHAGQLPEAEAAYAKAVAVQPRSSGLHALLANALLSVDKPVAAIEEAQREPDAQWRQLTLAIALDAAGRRSDANRAIALYETQWAANDPRGIALFYACRHDAKLAVDWLAILAAMDAEAIGNKPILVREGLPNQMECFKNIAEDPRYQALLR
jgi:TolB-like protein/DNA-binding winged helix-turn-helix (wHTH) protein